MRKVNRIISAILVVSMLCSLNAFAATSASVETLVQAEIETCVAEAYVSVYEQLEAQDALSLLDTYMNYFSKSIEASVKRKYGVDQPTVMGARSATVVAICEDGAVLTYEDPDTGCYVSSTHLDEEDTDTQLLSYSRTPKEIILDIGGSSFLGAFLDKIAKMALCIHRQSVQHLWS